MLNYFNQTISRYTKMKNSKANSLKDWARTSKLYWKYRHLIEPNVWETYQKDAVSKRRDFYSNFAREHNLKTIFEFGCGSGANYANLKNSARDVAYFGFDISSAAIKKANYSYNELGVEFHSELNVSLFRNFLRTHHRNEIDAAIYDRVIYLLSDKEIQDHLEVYSQYFRYVIIDDFHSTEIKGKTSPYKTRNFENLFHKFGFELLINEPSKHKNNSEFFSTYARRIILKKLKA